MWWLDLSWSEFAFSGLFLFPQIRGELSPVQEPSSLRPSPGHRPVPAKHLVSTGTAIKMKRNKIHHSQQPEAGAVSPKCSSHQDTRCTSLPKIDVSGAARRCGEKVCAHARCALVGCCNKRHSLVNGSAQVSVSCCTSMSDVCEKTHLMFQSCVKFKFLPKTFFRPLEEELTNIHISIWKPSVCSQLISENLHSLHDNEKCGKNGAESVCWFWFGSVCTLLIVSTAD